METEDDVLYNQITAYANPYGAYGSSGNAIDPNNFESPYNLPIEIPKTFKDVVTKMFPEIKDIVSVGYRETAMYCPTTFHPIKNFLVGVDLYFEETNGMKKSKKEYGEEIGDYFRMTYGSEMDFISFHVQSFIFPPERTNKDKFFELFGKD